MPRKMCKFRLARNSTKFYVLARFLMMIPTVNLFHHPISRELITHFLNEINNFIMEITILPFFQKLEFLGSYSKETREVHLMVVKGEVESRDSVRA